MIKRGNAASAGWLTREGSCDARRKQGAGWRRSGWTAAPAATCRCSTSTRRWPSLAGAVDLVFGPLVDAQEFPENVDVTLVEGAVSSQDDLRADADDPPAHPDPGRAGRLRGDRQRARHAQQHSRQEAAARASTWRAPTAPGVPNNGVPALLRHASPLHESVRVDLHVPGCPPRPEAISVRAHRAAGWPQDRPD